MDLEMTKNELASMVDIPQMELNARLERINSLKDELQRKQNRAAIEAEVEAEMRDDGQSYNINFDNEFQNL